MSDNHSEDEHCPNTKAIRTSPSILKNPHQQMRPTVRVPVCLRFILSDGTKMDAAARHYIMLGRKDNDNNQQIDLDFTQLGGQEHGVSRCHAIVQITSTTVFIKDFNSRNGTFLNGYELHPMRQYVINDGDEIVLGRIQTHVKFIY
ncbi:MAG: FHA domain-containing protein [Anaerolineae bacterium]|nr:FHA domain-containing protein [Anaerolineae bacterium]MDQ7034203.1 FHA domain-containing protein [Anaerolineae bacterium]